MPNKGNVLESSWTLTPPPLPVCEKISSIRNQVPGTKKAGVRCSKEPWFVLVGVILSRATHLVSISLCLSPVKLESCVLNAFHKSQDFCMS